jgi:peptidoglycan/LPS O-acetylase OafA/YrhL
MPIYYGTLLLGVVFHNSVVVDSFWWFAAYLGDIKLATLNTASTVSHFWTLAVEEQFYLMWPWVVLATSSRQLRRVCVGAIVLAPLFRLSMVSTGHPAFGGLTMFGQTDALGAGALLATYRHEQRLPAAACRSLYGLVAGLLVLGLFVSGLGDVPGVGVILPTAMTGLLAPVVAYAALELKGPLGWALKLKPLRYVGRISYGVYVYHPFMIYVVPAFARAARISIPRTGTVSILVLIAASLIVGSASWHLIERPIGILRAHLTGQSGVAVSATF